MPVAKIDMEPVAKGRPRFSRYGHAFTPAKTRAFEQDFGMQFRQFYMEQPTDKLVEVNFLFGVKKPKKSKFLMPRTDIDNYIKACCDALNGILYVDDSQIVKIMAHKYFSTEPHIIVQWNLLDMYGFILDPEPVKT